MAPLFYFLLFRSFHFIYSTFFLPGEFFTDLWRISVFFFFDFFFFKFFKEKCLALAQKMAHKSYHNTQWYINRIKRAKSPRGWSTLRKLLVCSGEKKWLFEVWDAHFWAIWIHIGKSWRVSFSGWNFFEFWVFHLDSDSDSDSDLDSDSDSDLDLDLDLDLDSLIFDSSWLSAYIGLSGGIQGIYIQGERVVESSGTRVAREQAES